MRGRANTEVAFWSQVDRSAGDDACWPWTGKTRGVAGAISFGRRNTSAHRLAWELTHGVTLPKGRAVSRTCRTPTCCNPAHLYEGPRGTQSQHARSAKLTWEIVREIRRAFAAKEGSQYELAEKYAVSQASVSMLLAGKTWREDG